MRLYLRFFIFTVTFLLSSLAIFLVGAYIIVRFNTAHTLEEVQAYTQKKTHVQTVQDVQWLQQQLQQQRQQAQTLLKTDLNTLSLAQQVAFFLTIDSNIRSVSVASAAQQIALCLDFIPLYQVTMTNQGIETIDHATQFHDVALPHCLNLYALTAIKSQALEMNPIHISQADAIKKLLIPTLLSALETEDFPIIGIALMQGDYSFAVLTQDVFNSFKPIQTQLNLQKDHTSCLVMNQLYNLYADTADRMIGYSINEALSTFSVMTSQPILISTSHGESLYYDIDGTMHTDHDFLNDRAYIMAPLEFLSNQEMSYDMLMQDRATQIHTSFQKFEQSLMRHMSLQMIIVMMSMLILGAIILKYTIRQLFKPIELLVAATNKVTQGELQHIQLPKVEGKDELSLLTQAFYKMVKGLQDKEKILNVLNKVVSKEVAAEILKTPLHLGGEEKEVSMLFSDIRGFTQLTQGWAPQKIIKVLNSYMTKMFRVIEGEGGVIDKYVGDEIMALYGAPALCPEHAVKAIATALLMIEVLKKWNQERAQHNEPPVQIGIGIHTGIVVAGNMGAEDRLNYTVIGSNANLGARLCAAAEAMEIIISESTYQQPQVKQLFRCEPKKAMMLKGFDQPIASYRILGFHWEA